MREPFLKNCPFCAGEDLNLNDHEENCFVACLTCKAMAGQRKTIKAAIEAWNNRADLMTIYAKNAECFSNQQKQLFKRQKIEIPLNKGDFITGNKLDDLSLKLQFLKLTQFLGFCVILFFALVGIAEGFLIIFNALGVCK